MRGAFACGERIRSTRVSLGLTQEQLADLANLDVKSVRKAEQSKRLDVATLARLADALELDLAVAIRPADDPRHIQDIRRRVVERWVAAWDARDIEGILSVYHDRCALYMPGAPGIPFSGTSVGKDAIRSTTEMAWSTARTVLQGRNNHAIHVSHTTVVLHGKQGVHRPTGEVVRLSCVQIFAFEGDKVIEHHVEYDTIAMRRILQLPADESFPE